MTIDSLLTSGTSLQSSPAHTQRSLATTFSTSFAGAGNVNTNVMTSSPALTTAGTRAEIDHFRANSVIPKKAHWVWLGKPLPQDFARNINKFVDRNPDYKPTLWVNKKSWSTKHRAALENLSSRVEIRNIDEAFDTLNVKLTSAFERECSGSHRNYAAASDIARCAILYSNGGVYMDVDAVVKHDMPLRQLAADKGILIYPRGNGVIAATLGNKYVGKVIEKIISAYAIIKDTSDKQDQNDPMFSTKRSFNHRDEYLTPDSQQRGLPIRMNSIRNKDMDKGLGDPSVARTAPRLSATMDATGPNMWSGVLVDVITHDLPPVYFEEIDASAKSYTLKPERMRRDSI